MRNRIAMIVTAMLFTLTSACGGEEKKNDDGTHGPESDISQLQVEWDWLNEPVANTEHNAATLTVTTQPGQTVEVVDVDPQMPSHGHGTAKNYQKVEPASSSAENATAFKVSGLFFVMSGPWVINVTLKVDNETVIKSFPVEVK